MSGFSGNSGAGSGTVTSVAAEGLTVTSTGTIPPRYGFANATLAASAGSSALTIALKDNAGNDPSASSPANFNFRNVTGTAGSWTQVAATGAMSLVISSGSTMGVTSSTAFRIWVVMFNDAGTLRLGAINCSTASATAAQIFPLNETVPASSTAEGGAGASDSAGVFYTGTAVSAKSFVILGYIEWNSTGLTAGTWTTTNLNFIQTMGPGVKKPGDSVQHLMTTTTTGVSTTSASYSTALTQAITPTSAANLVRASTSGRVGLATLTNPAYVTLFRTANQLQSEVFVNLNAATIVGGASLGPFLDKPNTASSVTYTTQLASDGTHAATFAASGDSGVFATLVLTEIMG